MTTYPFYQLDVFTEVPLGGNPLAVFTEASGLDGDTMQALAREMNLSETTFVLPSTKATRKVRIFTPAAEVPLAGHPTIGTWWLLAELGMIDLDKSGSTRITQETGAGVLPVDIHTANGAPDRVVMVQTQPVFGDVVEEVDTLAACLGAAPESVRSDPIPQVVSTAMPQLIVPFSSLKALQDLPSGGAGSKLIRFTRELGTDCAMCYSFETVDPSATVHCRMFAPAFGVPEDPATGSAAGALGAYLVHNGIIRPENGTAEIVVEQGIEMGRPSIIEVSVDVGIGAIITEVRVGGKAITIIKGEVTL